MSFTSFANTDFTGIWQLDLIASDSIDEILKAQGKARIERMVAKSMAVSQNITQHSNQITIHVKSKAIDDIQVFKLNNLWQTIQTPRMGSIQTKSFWSRNKRGMTTIMKIQADKKPASMFIKRFLINNGQTMQLNIRLLLDNGKTHLVKRIFRRV